LGSADANESKFDLFQGVEPSDDEFLQDMFENKDYKVFFDSSVWEDYEDIVYYISRGQSEKSINEYNKQHFKPNEKVRPNGDTILHVCAEYG
jgi:hypothetical protein